MTDQNFSLDKGNEGTTESSFNQEDQNLGGGDNSGNTLQHQMDVMQKRIGDKDTFIGTLKDENQTLREKMADFELKLDAMGTVEEQLARMEAAKNSNQDTNLDEDTLVSKVLGTLDAKSLEKKQSANFERVKAEITKKFGADKVDSIVGAAASENGLAFEDMIDLSKKSPQAVLKMVGVQAAMTGTTNPSQGTSVGYGTDDSNRDQKLADYARMRKENPKEFYKPAEQAKFRELCLQK